MRYQVVYSKRGVPFVFWTKDKDNALKMADGLQRAGYSVSVWQHNTDGAREIDF